MGKALIIAEKPSVAADIAKALGGFKKQDDYYESDAYALSSAVGHLLELRPKPFRHEFGRRRRGGILETVDGDLLVRSPLNPHRDSSARW